MASSRPPLLLLLALVALLSAPLQAATRYVSPAGTTAGTGTTLTAPWSLAKALSSSLPGDVIYLRGGIYPAPSTGFLVGVSGTAAARITFLPYTPPGGTAELPIIDGSGVVAGFGGDFLALLDITNRSYLTFRGIEIRNLRSNPAGTATNHSDDVIGVLVIGNCDGIRLENLNIHHIESAATNAGDWKGAANGIMVWGNGTTAAAAVNDLVIDGCIVHDLKTYWSESIAINGNVDRFTVSNCTVYNCDNIGIDCIGFEGASPVAALDQARNGTIIGNTVYNIDSLTNPAYEGDQAAGGIYVDGGTNIVIEQNKVYSCNIGIELASEALGRVTSNCIARNNWVWNCHIGGIFMGGHMPLENGGTSGCSVLNNTLFHNDTLNRSLGEIVLQNFVSNCTIKNNIIFATAQKYFITNSSPAGASAPTGMAVDYNLYYSDSGATTSSTSQWRWLNTYRYGFTSWTTATGFDTNSTFADPRFVAPGATLPDLHLLSTSPGINSGDPTFVPAANEKDIDGDNRVLATVVDRGADEFFFLPPPVVTLIALDATMGEYGGDTGSFQVSRTGGHLNEALTVNLTFTGTASATADFLGLTSSITIPANQTSAVFTLTPVADSLSEGPETLNISLAVSSTYDRGSPLLAAFTLADRPVDGWKFVQFGAQANNAAIAGDLADPDNDGRANLIEYALGSTPNSPDSAMPLATMENGYLTISATKAPSAATATDVAITAEVQGGLGGTWLSGGAHVTILTNSPSQFKARDNTPVSAANRRFMRLKVARL